MSTIAGELVTTTAATGTSINYAGQSQQIADGKFRLIEVDIPDNSPSLFRLPNLDGRGPARYLHKNDLQRLRPRSLE